MGFRDRTFTGRDLEETLKSNAAPGGLQPDLIFENVSFVQIRFHGILFLRAHFIDCRFKDCAFTEQSRFTFTTFRRCGFSRCRFTKGDLDRNVFDEVAFEGCSFQTIVFDKSLMYRVSVLGGETRNAAISDSVFPIQPPARLGDIRIDNDNWFEAEQPDRVAPRWTELWCHLAQRGLPWNLASAPATPRDEMFFRRGQRFLAKVPGEVAWSDARIVYTPSLDFVSGLCASAWLSEERRYAEIIWVEGSYAERREADRRAHPSSGT
ncbi:MAG: pentapeptide repeat-containing protein [Myxococcota bacterium]